MHQVQDEMEEDPGEGVIVNVEEVAQILIGNVVEGEDVVVDIGDQEPYIHALDLIAELYANENAGVEVVDDGTVEYEFGSPVKFGAGEVNVVLDIGDQEPYIHALDLIAELYANENVQVEVVDDGTVEYEFGSPVKFGASEVDVPRIIIVVPNNGRCFKLTIEDSSLELIRIQYEDAEKEEIHGKEENALVHNSLRDLMDFYQCADSDDDADKLEMKTPSSGIISFGLHYGALNCSCFGGEALEMNAPAPVPIPAGT